MTTTSAFPSPSKIALVRQHYESMGYRVHSGLQFGADLVLYADRPDKVHSDFCIHIVVREDELLDWREMQTLVRSMPDLHKTLIVANVVFDGKDNNYKIEEIALATEHAPFRHRNKMVQVGEQRKDRTKQTKNASDEPIMDDKERRSLKKPKVA